MLEQGGPNPIGPVCLQEEGENDPGQRKQILGVQLPATGPRARRHPQKSGQTRVFPRAFRGHSADTLILHFWPPDRRAGRSVCCHQPPTVPAAPGDPRLQRERHSSRLLNLPQPAETSNGYLSGRVYCILTGRHEVLPFNQCSWDNWMATCQRTTSDPFLARCTQKFTRSSWITDLNLRAETVKILRLKHRSKSS